MGLSPEMLDIIFARQISKTQLFALRINN